ncbi:MAG: hypothetical protein GX921_04805, partial [Bacteroidales bacterium]|nr:hypothetical protein [Bacteroidales bacterium]
TDALYRSRGFATRVSRSEIVASCILSAFAAHRLQIKPFGFPSLNA